MISFKLRCVVSKHFDAVIVTEHISIWDVPSICVFNADAVKSFKNYTIEELVELYKVIEIKEHSLNEVLNNLGKQGWELCEMKDNDYIFKR